MYLQLGSLLQGGKYKIEKLLGQGGFGITYLAAQRIVVKGGIGELETEIKVAIKEFFMKDVCNRDSSSQVSVPSTGSKEMVERFKQKFVKEANNISLLKHPNIIKVLDIFEENGTAYYVMEYIQDGSLQQILADNGAMKEIEALHYIREVADALSYIHSRQMNHLDVKPGNILRRNNADAVLIDFGLSKRYDSEGCQTSTTPIGISAGYAPMEQYKKGGVGTFSPATDVYSLGATLYKLLTGETPPDASDVFDNGLPDLPDTVSSNVRKAIQMAMQPKRSDRPQSIREFLGLLGGDREDEDTILIDDKKDETVVVEKKKEEEADRKVFPRAILPIIGGVGLVVLVIIGFIFGNILDAKRQAEISDSIAAAADSIASAAEAAGIESADTIYVDSTAYVTPTTTVVAEHNPQISRNEPTATADEDSTAYVTPTTTVVAEHKPQISRNEPTSGRLIDLGLSVKWAAYNVGASSPEGYGGLYGWADATGEKRSTDNNDYPSSTPPANISGTQYDIARVKWGGSWRLPTHEEFKELSERCDWKWITSKGVNGYLVTGSTGNSIFLPAANWRKGDGDANGRGGLGLYWSGTLRSGYDAWHLFFSSVSWSPSYSSARYCGHSVRPVSE